MFNALTWMIWVGAILIALSATRNPLYVGLILLWIFVVFAIVRRRPAKNAPVPLSPLRFAAVVVVLSAVFNALTVHVGSTVLFRLPGHWLLLGGPVTVEALAFGAMNGLVLAGMFTAFTILNVILPIRALIQLIPRAFYPVAVVISIAITFVPTTLRQFQQIKEAQAVRGHRLHGLRDWLPLLLPLLVSGLERALQLAEAMMARGFASADSPAHSSTTRLTMIGGLVVVLSGWLLQLGWGQKTLGGVLLLAGIGLVFGALWVVGRRTPHTVYRPDKWTVPDWWALAGALVVTAVFLLPLPGLNRDSILYYPYPRLQVPAFNALIGGATLGLLVPVAWLGKKNDYDSV